MNAVPDTYTRQGQSTVPDSAGPEGEPVFHGCLPDPSCPYCNGADGQAGELLDWSFVDAVYCISLRVRDDRMKTASAEFHKVGLCRQVVFYRPEKHPVKGLFGSWESHRLVCQTALAQGAKRALIFEDDVQFMRRIRPRTLRAIRLALDGLPANWNVFYLGHWPITAWFVRHNVLRTSSLCAHAYIVSPRLMQWLSERPWGAPGVEKRRIFGKGLDNAFAALGDTYAYFPMIAGQSGAKSDNFNFLTPDKPGKTRKQRKLKHLITHSRYREVLLSRLMRSGEMVTALLSPVYYLSARIQGLRSRKVAGGE